MLPFLYSAWAIILILIIINQILVGKHDPKEPPAAPQTIPIFGHLVGMMRKKVRYYVRLRQSSNAPIYSLIMPGGFKLHVINSMELISAVQKQPRLLAFPPVGVKFAMVLAGSSKEANRIAKTNINGEEGDWGLSMDFNKVVYPALSPGPSLGAMNKTMMAKITATLDSLSVDKIGSVRIGLCSWVRHELTVGITDSVYGPGNPLRDKAIEDAFWDFEHDLFRIMMNLLPTMTARKGSRGRQIICDAFTKYFSDGSLKDASTFAQSRYASAASYKVAVRDIARFEAVNLIGILTSTIRTVTWMLYHIYSDPAVLDDCRREIRHAMTEDQTPAGTKLRMIDISGLRSISPILGSTFQEVLRHHAIGTSVRQVMHDTLLEDTYLLKRDSMVLMPSVVIHSDPSIWGSDVAAFDHKRFLKPTTTANGRSKGKPPSAAYFRAFGGGTTLCPGRHFATNITMAMTMMCLMRYDIVPVEGGWPRLTAEKTHMVAAVEQPDFEVEVEVRRRSSWEEAQWAFRLDGSSTVLATVAEDVGV